LISFDSPQSMRFPDILSCSWQSTFGLEGVMSEVRFDP